ncbi:methylated-DNA--[protein]-cysteine S-methyltransferase [Rhodococcus sp. 1168]|uniref:methylated-DNA--[protein]-cysteine S-methyltransferase n=1 Tax=Rhodococcus sp. 1168 TaxID=2018041 RepID=UPI000A0A84DD|nr:MGMT family protein [Rhodococcus sp. 1168]ORI19223.1 hypothetical protein BJI47_12100 [Rhodococcus sp. 1168]
MAYALFDTALGRCGLAWSDAGTTAVGLPESDYRNRMTHSLNTCMASANRKFRGALAARLGQPGAAQAVGGALGRNPVPIVIPCHRVLGAGCEVGGFSAPDGASTKEKILSIEGVTGFGEPTLF